MIITVLTIALLFPIAMADTLTYRNTTGSETTSTVYVLSRHDSGKKARVEWHERDTVAVSEVIMNDSFATQRWQYWCEQRKSRLNGHLDNDTIHLSGTFKNDSVHKRFSAKWCDWRQMFPFDLREFVISDSTYKFMSGISICGFASMRFGTLLVQKLGIERQTVEGREIELLHVRAAPPGYYAIFWHGDYWFEKKTGTLVMSVSTNRPGAPPTLVMLIQ